jgi:hypothetical protein
MTIRHTLQSGAVAACAGFLTRPCCFIPATLSVAGVGTAGLSSLILTHRTALICASTVLTGTSIWMNVRGDGAWLNKILALIATAFAFLLSAGWLGVL